MKILKFIRQATIMVAFAFISIFLVVQGASAQVKIVTSVPDFAAIAKRIGGEKVEVVSLAKGYQNPHFVDAKPIFITKLNQSDLLIYNGLELEIGWLPILINGARNSNIVSPSSLGNYNASTSINSIVEVPTSPVDRSMGDVHPSGNPHFMLDPRNGVPVAREIMTRLIRIDSENAAFYEENFNSFAKTLRLKISQWETELAPFKGASVVTYHKAWGYFLGWAGLKEAGVVEPKPGIPPTPSHVAQLIRRIEQRQDIKLIIATNYYPRKIPEIIARKVGVDFLALPAFVGGRDGIRTYIELFDVLIGEITSALKNKKAHTIQSARSEEE